MAEARLWRDKNAEKGFGQCAMVAPGPRMGGDFASTFRKVLDGIPMDHGEVPHIFQ